MGIFDRKKSLVPPGTPSPGGLTPGQIAEDMKRYAQENPYHGGLHAVDAREARKRWREMRKGGVGGDEDAGNGPAAAPAARAKMTIRPCIEHPETKGVWSCVDCGSNFCDLCVRPVMSYYNTAHGGYEHRSGVCPRCKGRCIDLRFESEKRERIRNKQAETQRSEAFRRTMLAILTLQFLLGALYRYRQVTLSLDLQYMLFVFGVLQYGPLRNIGIVTKSYFVRVLPPAMLANAASYLVAGLSGSFIGHILFLTPVKYLGISFLLYGAVMTVEKTAELFGHIYTGSQEPAGWTTFDRVSAGLSVAIIALFVLYLLATSVLGLANFLGR